LSLLKRADEPLLSVRQAEELGLDLQALVHSGLLRRAKEPSDYVPRGCERGGCLPNFDWDRRRAQGLVGIACADVPACWSGWQWARSADVERVWFRAADAFAALRERNGLVPLEAELSSPLVPVGLLRRRGLKVPVVWLRWPRFAFEIICHGLRVDLEGDGLIVLVGSDPRIPFHPRRKTAVIELAPHRGDDLGLTRGLDIIDPTYRERRVEEPSLDFDDIRIRFATQPGTRHTVLINGHDFGGFRKSDVKYLRLLLLAASRVRDPDPMNGGWIDKARLRSGDDKDRDLKRLREELGTYDVPGLSEEERRGLIKAHRGTGLIRLAIPPENIAFDESLAALTWISPTTTMTSDGVAGELSARQEEGLENARVLLRDCRRLGVPGNVGDEPETPLRGRKSRGRGPPPNG
jgi:hypothetical protein